MAEFLILIIALGTLNALIALHNGRNPVLGGLLGFLFGIFSIIIYIIIGKTDLKKIEEAEEIKKQNEKVFGQNEK